MSPRIAEGDTAEPYRHEDLTGIIAVGVACGLALLGVIALAVYVLVKG